MLCFECIRVVTVFEFLLIEASGVQTEGRAPLGGVLYVILYFLCYYEENTVPLLVTEHFSYSCRNFLTTGRLG